MSHFQDIASLLATEKPTEPVYALRCAAARMAAKQFVATFPGDVLYAVKSNPHPSILASLAEGGIHHFDVASLEEIELIHQLFPLAHSYFMHPVKSDLSIRKAVSEHGVRCFVADHPDEIQKIRANANTQDLTVVIRLATDRGVAVYDLGGKFGCSVELAIELTKKLEGYSIPVAYSFHVGSQCLEPSAYEKALTRLASVLEATRIHPEFIDVGGGFPVAYRNSKLPELSEYVAAINSGLKALPLKQPVRLLAEPGRSLSASSASLIVKVELRRDNKLYLNDGMYGGLSELRFEGLDVPMRVWRLNERASPLTGLLKNFSFYGPTCDSSDALEGPFPLPHDIAIGDYIEIGQMGAYSISLRTPFNGFNKISVHTVSDPAFLP